MEKNNQPLVSVVIPCYNHEQFVQDCIQSVIDQTYENIELIIIDDGSKDHSVESIQRMVSKCEERFVRFEFRSRPNKGLSATLNEAIQWCKGGYFSIIASDDLMLEKKTAIQVDFLEKNLDTVALFGSADYIDENNNIKSQNCLKEKEYVFDKIFLNECAFFAPTQMLRMNTLLKIGGFDEKILVEDWYMWLKMAEKGRVYCLSDKLAKYRIHSNNSTKNAKFIYDNNLKTLNNYKSHKLYGKSYNKIRWIYVTWSGQTDKRKSVELMFEFLKEKPTAIFSIYFLMFCKYFVFKMKNWF